MIKSTILSHVATACICTSGAVVAPKVVHRIHHPKPAIHKRVAHVRPKLIQAPPTEKIVYRDCPVLPYEALIEPQATPAQALVDTTDAPRPLTQITTQRPGLPFNTPALPINLIPIVSPPPPSGVPEPATWGMMVIGFGAVGVAVRRSKVKFHV